ncbi:MAG: glycosyltransferase family 4 protein [Streptosporangiaceae bacterium]
MPSDQPAGKPDHRGRVVMLVDNSVNGDSRVQKAAESAADAGWEVILLGRSPDRQIHRWQLGRAKVQLLPLPRLLHRRPHELRRVQLRRPLAYPVGPVVGRRQQWAKARGADLRTRRAAAGPALGRRAALIPARIRVGVYVRWVALRARQTYSLARTRKAATAPIDRFTTAFWQRAMGDRSWRRLDQGLWDYELAFGSTVDKLKPDLIHANDFRMIGVGARAKIRARAAGRDVKLVWDAHEYLPGLRPYEDHPRWLPALCAHEREYGRYADAVVTVSESLADLLVDRHGLTERPTVVLNTPELRLPEHTETPDLRALCGVGPHVPLLVYAGSVSEQRGLATVIEALPFLNGVHVALVVLNPAAPFVRETVGEAEALGVAGRVHVLPYVPHHQVVGLLAGADIGLIPIHHWPNHEIALITKFFEYSHARLPIIVSDVETMSAMVRTTGQGEVFEARNTPAFVAAVQTVLAEPKRYRDVYEQPGFLDAWSWQAQAEILDEVYAGLVR